MTKMYIGQSEVRSLSDRVIMKTYVGSSLEIISFFVKGCAISTKSTIVSLIEPVVLMVRSFVGLLFNRLAPVLIYRFFTL